MAVKGLIISGKFSEIIVREKTGQNLELGELLIADTDTSQILLQVYDLFYGSQISQQNLELVSGMKLEEQASLDFMDKNLRNYNLALLKNLITIKKDKAVSCKSLPDFFTSVREVTAKDLSFLTTPEDALFVGKLRSGSKMLDFDLFLPGPDVFSHHILISATTGRGKSNLASVILWDIMSKDYCGILVLDPHDEYYGRNTLGLKDHPEKDKLAYYTPSSPPPGARTLKINLDVIKPTHFRGVVNWTLPQLEALTAYYNKFGKDWIISAIHGKKLPVNFHEGTLEVIKRRLLSLLQLEFFNNQIICKGVFDTNSGSSTISDICNEIEKSNVVVVDTSGFSGSSEILIGSIITTEIFNRYRKYKTDGIKDKPVVSILLEEAPRVLGKDVLEKGSNIFSTIAREGRKFKIGLTAITQLPSLIPRQILANMNTKIILGIEMQPERQAIIDSAAQDLSSDSRAIASLDKGEAIITSNFARFAMPVRIPLFRDFAKRTKKNNSDNDYSGILFE